MKHTKIPLTKFHSPWKIQSSPTLYLFFLPAIFHLMKLTALLFRGEYYITENGTVRVCVHGFIGRSRNIFYKLDRYISFLFNIVPICAVFITLITYTLFKELRNLPGLNLMCLATSIFASRVKQFSNMAQCDQISTG